MIEATPLQAADLGTLAEGVNWLWILVVTFLIFFMYAGFAMLEAGQVRAKNVANQLTKNMLTWSVGVVTFFLLGAGISGLVGVLTGPETGAGALTQFGAGLVPEGVLSVEVSMFLPQIAGTLVITVWTVAATGLVWGIFKTVGQARVTPDHEREGLDVTEHGTDTYPEFGVGDSVASDGGFTEQNGIVRPDGGEASDASRTSSDRRSDGGSVAANDGIELVMAFVRPDRLSNVKASLAEVGAPSLTVTNVSGRGSQPAKTGQWRGEEYSVDLHQKVKVECVVASGPAGPQRSGESRGADVPAENVAEAIRDAAKTGEPGDGKVFVLPVEQAYQIRTGEVGTSAV